MIQCEIITGKFWYVRANALKYGNRLARDEGPIAETVT